MSHQTLESKSSDLTDDASTGSTKMKPLGVEPITIGDALEITAFTAGNKPIEQSDAAAIWDAEIRASGLTQIAGLAAADMNDKTRDVEDKTKLSDILVDASYMLERDKTVTIEDAEGVSGAEVQNHTDRVTFPGGVSASIISVARLNQDPTTQSRGEY